MSDADRCQLHCGDCLDILPTLPDASVDMVLCDLPYGTTACKWDSVIPFEPLWREYRRVTKPNAAIVLTASQPFTSALVMSNPEWFRHEWVWLKNIGSNFANTKREPFKEHESAVVFSPGGWTFNKQMQTRTGGGADRAKYSDTYDTKSSCYGAFAGSSKERRTEFRVPSSYQRFNCERGLHPTQKPVPLMEYLIRTYTEQGDVVLDNCMGSGTTGVACVNTDRKFIGIEREPSYFAIAQERIHAQPLRLAV